MRPISRRLPLNVIREEAAEHPDRLSDLRIRFYGVLDGLVPQQAKEFCDPRTFVKVGEAHEQILEHIREKSIDLLVLGIRKTSHLCIEMRTSGAFPLILDAECPVLTLQDRQTSSGTVTWQREEKTGIFS
jgi:hypothetical protein